MNQQKPAGAHVLREGNSGVRAPSESIIQPGDGCGKHEAEAVLCSMWYTACGKYPMSASDLRFNSRCQ